MVSPSKRTEQVDGCFESAQPELYPPAEDVTPRKKQPVIPTNRNGPLEAESAIDSGTEDNYASESVDGDDDSSDWEDATDSSRSSADDMFSQRVEPKSTWLSAHPSLNSCLPTRGLGE